jgi:hypothetical protein
LRRSIDKKLAEEKRDKEGKRTGYEEGAAEGPLDGCADAVVVNYYLRVQVGHTLWSLWRVDTKGVPVTLSTGHPADMRLYPLALPRISLDAMVLSSRNI